MPKGPLIFPKLVEIGRFDTAAVALAQRYDRNLREIRSSNLNTAISSSTQIRPETVVRVKAQIETDTFQRLAMGGLGNAPQNRIVCVMHAPELEAAGLFDVATMTSLLKPTDRLLGIYDVKSGALVHKIEDPPGMYATQCKPSEYGFNRSRWNLLEITFEGRPPGTSGAGA